jgi:hypothetical protein
MDALGHGGRARVGASLGRRVRACDRLVAARDAADEAADPEGERGHAILDEMPIELPAATMHAGRAPRALPPGRSRVMWSLFSNVFRGA